MRQATMHVLILTNTYPTAARPGATPAVRDQVDALSDLGVTATVRHLPPGRLATYLGAAARTLAENLARLPYDLIHAHYGHCGLIAQLQRRRPVVVTFHGSDLLHPRDGRIGRLAAKGADGIIVMSPEMKLASGREDARVIPFGVNTRIFSPADQSATRRALDLPLDGKLVLFPYRPERPEKRFDLAQAAVAQLRGQGYAVEMIALYDQPRERVAMHMAACDAMLMTSDYEGAPMAVREALACNLPVVSTPVGDVPALIGSIPGCHLCRQDPADIAAKVAAVFQAGDRIDGAAYSRRYDARAAAEQVLALYTELLGHTVRPSAAPARQN